MRSLKEGLQSFAGHQAPPIAVLMTGAGAPGAPGVINSLRSVKNRDIYIIGVDADPEAQAAPLLDDFFVVPRGDASNYLAEMQWLTVKTEADVLLPLTDAELLPLAKARDQFGRTRVCVSDPEAIYVAGNKYRTLLKFEEPIPVPQFVLTRTCDGFVAACYRLGYPDKPVCFKPPVSGGSRGFRIVDADVDEKDAILHLKLDQNVRVCLGQIAKIFEKTEPFPQLLVMEYLPGVEYAVDALADRGRTLVAIPRIEEKKVVGNSTRSMTVKNPDLEAYMTTIVQTLNLHGPIGIQVKEAADGTPKLLEINPRLHGASCTAWGAGVNLPYLAIQQALGEDLDIPIPRWGTRMIRIAKEYYEDTAG